VNWASTASAPVPLQSWYACKLAYRGRGVLRDTWERVSFWLSVGLGALTIANLLKHGLSVALHGLPQLVAEWYRFFFHGLFDLIFFWWPYVVPLWVKDLFSAYLIVGFICLRACTLKRRISFLDEVAETDSRDDLFAQLARFVHLDFIERESRSKRVWNATVAGPLIFLGWPFVVPYLYANWTNEARSSAEHSESLIRAFDRYPSSSNAYSESLSQLEHAWDADSGMFWAIQDRDTFALALSLSANFVFMTTVLLFVWSELSVAPGK
jgi:hypothetical protein